MLSKKSVVKLVNKYIIENEIRLTFVSVCSVENEDILRDLRVFCHKNNITCVRIHGKFLKKVMKEHYSNYISRYIKGNSIILCSDQDFKNSIIAERLFTKCREFYEFGFCNKVFYDRNRIAMLAKESKRATIQAICYTIWLQHMLIMHVLKFKCIA